MREKKKKKESQKKILPKVPQRAEDYDDAYLDRTIKKPHPDGLWGDDNDSGH